MQGSSEVHVPLSLGKAGGTAQGQQRIMLWSRCKALGSHAPSAQNNPDGKASLAFAASSPSVSLPYVFGHLLGVEERNQKLLRLAALSFPKGQSLGFYHRDSNKIEALSGVS